MLHRRFVRTVVNSATLAALLLAFVGCAQDVGDIDRTQPNKVRKADLEGTWYMLETVTHVPSTTWATIEGETSKLEKVLFRVEESYLFAYRAYPLLPGSDNVDRDIDYGSGDYYEAPIAAFPILKHFDIKRDYNANTGEQTNVLTENDYDRPWFEREYMRVDWSKNAITNFDLISEWLFTPIEASYHIDPERDEARHVYFERDANDQLAYFDLPRRLLVEPDLYGCIISSPWYGWSTEDCAPAEIEMVTSFARTDLRRDYEPLPYSDQQMSRFGYFRSERYVYDGQRGVLESTRQEMIQRHNTWQQSYRRDADGNFARDAEGRMIPIPLDQRELRTITYYLSQTFPDDPLIQQAAVEVADAWDVIFRQTAALAKNVAVDTVPRAFAVCHNPVVEGDDPACGAVGFEVRPGDLRYSTLHWVEAEQLDGPLGYGPSAADPETGEIISGRAYVYGPGINTYASFGVDTIRFINGDLNGAELANLDHVRAEVVARASEATNLDQLAPGLDRVPIGSRRTREPQRMADRQNRRNRLEHFDRNVVEQRMQAAREAGLGGLIGGEEYDRARAARLGVPRGTLDKATLDLTDPTQWMSPTHLKELQRRRRNAMARGIDYADMLDPNVLGLARRYAGNTDYDAIWRELRAEIFRSTALHEVGHTLGLRHNFQATYDSLNYFDNYWDLRSESLFVPETMGDLYRLNALTEKQLDGRMREYQYSSIMDYGYTFNTDTQGLGRYDMAAVVYGYTGGSYVAPAEADCSGLGKATGADGECLVRSMGYVEVFDKNRAELGRAGEILTSRDEQGFRFDDPTTPIVPYLERWHYTTVMQSFPTMEDAFDRRWVKLDDYLAARSDDQGPVRVPYLFCGDEWVTALLSCQVFDHGADPFEMTRTIADHYRSYYYFYNFKRDRLGWDPFNVLFSAFYYEFLPLSDYFQNWYLAPEGADAVMDDYWWLSINAGFNVLAEVMATPPYGTFCTRENGDLFNLSDELGGGPQGLTESYIDYYMTVYCDESKPFYDIPQGEGRRRFSAYDVDAGYNFADMPLEAGHYWTTLAAVWAIVDPEAYVLGTEADAGVFAISYYDFFAEEMNQLVSAVITEDYKAYSPVIEATEDADGVRRGRLHYRPMSPVIDYDLGISYDPESGAELDALVGPRPGAAICEPCTDHSDCHGYTGFLGGTYCGFVDSGSVAYCLQDCWEDPGLCTAGESCDANGNCVPDAGTCVGQVPSCSPSAPHGGCPAGESCDSGACAEIWPVVESDATFMIVDDLMFYGMFYSTFNYSTRFNDNVFVWRLGTDETIEPGPGFETVSFTDPLSGFSYGALAERCDENAPDGGPIGLCGACSTHADCAGYTGDYAGVWCRALTAGGPRHCLVDCLQDASACPAGNTCNASGNCVPDDGVCDDELGPCSASFPLGACPEGQSCVEGVCEAKLSVRCAYGINESSSAAAIVARGQELVRAHEQTLDAYWSYDGGDLDRETELWWKHSRSRYELETHVDKISTLRAIFAIFGKIY